MLVQQVTLDQQQKATHRKQYDGDGERYGDQHGHADAQDQRVVRVDAAVGVQQLSLNLACRRAHTYTKHTHVNAGTTYANALEYRIPGVQEILCFLTSPPLVSTN